MWSRKPVLVVLGLLIVVLAILTNKINTDKVGGHRHEREGDSAKQIDKSKMMKLCPRLKPLDIKVITAPSGLKYQDIRIGSGRTPKSGETVVVNYTGWKTSGKPFDTTDIPGMKPIEFAIGRKMVIPGWEEGLRTMKVGGKRRLIIPPNLAYGMVGHLPVIEPNATLIFDVELKAIKGSNK